jgi:hypothetical protein
MKEGGALTDPIRPIEEKSIPFVVSFALLRKIGPSLLLPQVLSVTVHWPHNQRSKVLRSKRPWSLAQRTKGPWYLLACRAPGEHVFKMGIPKCTPFLLQRCGGGPAILHSLRCRARAICKQTDFPVSRGAFLKALDRAGRFI